MALMQHWYRAKWLQETDGINKDVHVVIKELARLDNLTPGSSRKIFLPP